MVCACASVVVESVCVCGLCVGGAGFFWRAPQSNAVGLVCVC